MEFAIDLPKNKTRIWDLYVPILKSTDGRHKTIYITEAFTSPCEYNEACHELRTALPGDTIDIIINSPGGYTGSAFMLVDAIKNSKATITAHLSGEVASAATIVTMACDDIVVADHTSFMVHNYSHGAAGTGAQVKEYVNFIDTEFTEAVKIIYAGFLTPKEMTTISKQDKEIWLNKKEVLERWNNKLAYELAPDLPELAKKPRGRPAKKKDI